jgi:hypothetical protein
MAPPMGSPKCNQNVAAEPPPFNRKCTDAYCHKTSYARGLHCTQRHLPPDTPVSSWDDAIAATDPNQDGDCWCCCSCFAEDTQLEVTSGKFDFIPHIIGGQQILAAGVDLRWKPTTVAFRTGDADSAVIPGLYYVEYKMPGETVPRHLLVTPDHLFLMSQTKTLKKVQFLIPGDKLATADGGSAVVQFAVSGEHFTTIQSIEMDGPVDPRTLDGHLLNCNGVVTADYAVQVIYEMGSPAMALLAVRADQEVHEVGSEEYRRQFRSSDEELFVQSPARWPRGFVPHNSQTIPVPLAAFGYLTADQAKAVGDNGKFNPPTIMVGRDDLLYLFKQSRLLFPDVVCLLDWPNAVPNAYAWQANGQKFLLVTGGLVRLQGFFLQGLALVLGTLQASGQRNACVCVWDYQATFSILRDALPSTSSVRLIAEGIKQVEQLFALAGDGSQGDDACAAPSLACRLESYRAGLSFLDVPECAGAWPKHLQAMSAYASIDNASIVVRFNDRLDAATAGDTGKYVLSPAAQVTAATVSSANATEVMLSVNGLTGGGAYYVLVFGNLVSAHGAPLDPGQTPLVFTTN